MSQFWTDDKVRTFWRYPDKMPEAKVERLPVFEQRGDYVCQQKLDGYRLVIMIDDEVKSLSRHMKKLPVSQQLLNSILDIGLPPGTMLDAEWIKMRGGQTEQIAILDGLYIGGEWVGAKPLVERRNLWFGRALPSGIIVPHETTGDFKAFMAEQIDETTTPDKTLSEGVVVKRLSAKLIGDRSKSAENPLWAKIKWRQGEAGDTVVIKKSDLITEVNHA